MRKKVLFLLAALLGLASAQAQTVISSFPYYNHFGYSSEYDGYNGWTTVSLSDNEDVTAFMESYSDVYSLGYTQEWNSETYDYDYTYYSADDWLISPQVNVNLTAMVMEFIVYSYNYYYPGHLQVYVATGNTTEAFLATAPVLDTMVDYYCDGLSVSLADYYGQNVYVALRHVSNEEDEMASSIDVYSVAIRSTNTPSFTHNLYPVNLANLGQTDSIFVTLTEGSEDGLSYSWASNMMDDGTATYTTNEQGDTLVITHTATGIDTLVITVANVYDTVYDTIIFQVVNFAPIAITAEEGYSTGFEADDDQNWYIFSDDGPNHWWLDTSVYKDGQYGLFVSNTGLDNHYDNQYTYDEDYNYYYPNSTSMAVRAFNITDTGDYAISFDWRCDGSNYVGGSDSYSDDYMNVYLAKDFAGVNSSVWEWRNITGDLVAQTEWTSWNDVVNLDASWLGTVYLVFYWYNAGYGTNHPANSMAAAVDNISFAVSACTAPTDLRVENITTTGATVSWAAGGSETNWAYSVDGGEYIPLTTTTVNLTDLASGTNHTFAVRAVCDVEGEVASIDATISFFTECDVVSTLPWREDFESYQSSSYGSDAISLATQNPCWSAGTDYPYGSYYPYIASPYSAPDIKCLYFYSYSYYSSSSYAVLPEMADSLSGLEMALDVSAYYEGDTATLYVGVIDSNDYEMGTPFDTIAAITATAEYDCAFTNHIVDFSNYTGNGHNILLLKSPISGEDSYVLVDNIEVYPIPTCPRPTTIARTSASDVSVSLAWNNTEANEYEVSLRAHEGDGDWTVQVVDDTVATFPNLVPGSVYDVKVRAICTSTDTSFAAVSTVRTLCSYDTFPYVENFDNPATTPCWIAISKNDYTSDNWSISNYTTSGRYYAYSGYTYAGAPIPDDYLVSPTYHIPSDAESFFSLIFYYMYPYYSSYTGHNYFTVLVCKDADPFDVSNYTDTLMTISGNYDEWTKFGVNMSQYAGHDINIAFHRTTDGGDVDEIYLSGIELRDSKEPEITISGNAVANTGYANPMTLNLSEGDPTGIVYTWTSKMVNAGQATVSYNADNTVATYTYSVAGYDTIMVTAQNTYGEDTVYVPVFVRDLHTITVLPYSTGFENAADNANWNIYSGTLNNWYVDTAVANTGSKSLYISNDGGIHNKYGIGNTTSYAHAYRGIQLDAGDYYISFDWRCGGGQYDAYLNPILLPDNATIEGVTYFYPGDYNYIPLAMSSLYGSPNSWQTHTYIFTVDEPGVYILDFLWQSSSYGSVVNPAAAIDDLTIGLLTCPAPFDVYPTNIGSNTMDITWTVMGNESQWEVTVGDNAPVVVDTDYYRAENLDPFTVYNVSVRSICGVGDTSFAVRGSYRTECEAVMDLPWVEDFDALDYSNNETEIDCWSHLGGGRQTINRNITLSGNSETDRSLRIYRTSSDSLDFVTVLPAFHATIAALEMNFYARPDNGKAGTLEVGYINDVTEYSNFTPIASFSAADSATFYSNADSSFRFVLKSVSFANAPDGSRMAIRNHVDSYHAGNWYVDSVEVKVIDGVDPYACAAPTGISATKLMDGVYQLDWSAGNEHKWQVEVTHNGNTEVRTVQSRPYTMSQIQPDDHYYIRVKAICNLTAESEWSEVYDMNTATPIDTTTTDTTGIGNVLSGSFSLMPNPATSTVTVRLSNVEGTATVAVIDMNGRKAGEWTVEDGSITIDLSNYARGAYFVRVVANEGTAMRKLIVQ